MAARAGSIDGRPPRRRCPLPPLLGLLASVSALEAARWATAAEIVAVTLHEEKRERRPVSGRPIVGVVLRPAGGALPQSAGRLSVELPPAAGLRLCGRIESRDGSYFAWFDEPAGGRAGPIVLELRRPRPLPLPRRPPPFLAVLVYLAERCSGRAHELLPVSPPEGPGAGRRRLELFVNSAGMAATLVVPRPGGPPLRSPCPPVDGDDLVVFDRICGLELEPGAGFGDSFLELRRGVSISRHPLGRQGP